MKWLKQLIWRWSQEGREVEEVEYSPKSMRNKLIRTSASQGGGDIDSDEGLNITVRKAVGGKIVSFRHYDHKTDRSNYKIYVVSDDLEFDKELGKMITLESMRM